jgi:hypothetical protein
LNFGKLAVHGIAAQSFNVISKKWGGEVGLGAGHMKVFLLLKDEL